MQGSFNNYNIIKLSHIETTCEAFEQIHHVVIDGFSDNMVSFVQFGKYGFMKTTDTSTMGYYLVEFVSSAYTLQDETKCD